MASMSTQGASSSSTPAPQWKFDVFLNFRGVDTRKGFTDHLHAALQRNGIITFRDDEKLVRGKPISQELLKAIEESRFAIVIFSRNYASSTWCLDELTKIVRCMKEMGMTVLPENIEKVKTWREALREVANISGWHLQDRLSVGPCLQFKPELSRLGKPELIVELEAHG
uniref:TIR domain-containing protein n=1 Tax=Fagus sylvatica TaxID=28930 RepID=A0A2N9F0T5_FAGSY